MTDAEIKLLNKLAEEIEYGPTQHSAQRHFALLKLTEAFEAGRKAVETPTRAIHQPAGLV